MSHSIANIRNEYSLNGLHETDLDSDPLKQFQKWFDEALSSQLYEPNAMHLSTSQNGRPSGRIVLLKGLDTDGFVFFTNYESQKGRQIEANPQVSLTFFWKELERQVRVEGMVEKVAQGVSDEYYASRPRGSRIGAWVSHQSEIISGREALENELKRVEEKFAGQDVQRPPHWGGYRVIPDYVEFWQGRPSRLHDRLAYNKMHDGSWAISRLAP